MSKNFGLETEHLFYEALPCTWIDNKGGICVKMLPRYRYLRYRYFEGFSFIFCFL